MTEPHWLPEVQKALWQEIVGAHALWQMYKKLYGHGEDRVELLNRSADSFFGNVQRLMIRDVLLAIARLTDPVKTSGKSNLVIALLAHHPKVVATPELAHALNAKLQDVAERCKEIRQHRKKLLAHSDLATKLGTAAEPLPELTRQQVDQALESISDAYNVVSVAVDETQAFFDDVIDFGGADALLRRLKEAERCREGRRR